MTVLGPPLRLLCGVLVLPLAACVPVTINITFPQERIEKAASNIEDMVRAPKPPAEAPPVDQPATPPRSDLGRSTWLGWLGPRVVEAQVPELRTRTPQVMAAIESRRVRFPELSAALRAGCIGENNQGLVEPRPGPGCSPAAGALAAAENGDRMLIYRTLVEQNNMPPGDLARVQAAFAKTNRERAGPGSWVQDDAGQWSRK